jgi:hypothetical protein
MLAASSFSFPPSPSPPRLYRQFFTREECQMLDATPPMSAVHEIYLLRVLMTRVLAAARANERPASIAHSVSTRKRSQRLSLKQGLSMLTAFCGAALTMASLARFEHKAQGPGPFLVDLLYPEDDDLDL